MNCPSLTQLESLLRARLSASEEKAVEAHVETCVLCQQALERLTTARQSSPVVPLRREQVSGGSGGPFLRQLEREPPTGACEALSQSGTSADATAARPDQPDAE